MSTIKTTTHVDEKGVIHTTTLRPRVVNLDESVDVPLKDGSIAHVVPVASKRCPYCLQLLVLQDITVTGPMAAEIGDGGRFISLHHNMPACGDWRERSDNIEFWAEGMITL